MTAPAKPILSATRPVRPELAELLGTLKPGRRIRISQTVRVGQKQWQMTVLGTFRKLNYLETGLATHRVREDDIIVPTLHFTKDNGELSSIALDEHTQVETV
jgi:hypothetical protein